MPEYITGDIKISNEDSIDSNEENFDKENSDNENSNEEN